MYCTSILLMYSTHIFYRCIVQMHCTGVFCTCILHMHFTHVFYASSLYNHSTHVLQPCVVHMYSTEVLYKCILQAFSTRVLYQYMVQMYSTDIFFISILDMYSRHVFCRSILHLYLKPVLHRCILHMYSVEVFYRCILHPPFIRNNKPVVFRPNISHPSFPYPPHNCNTPPYNLLPAAYSPGSETPECDAGHRARYRHATGTQLPPKQPQNTRPHATPPTLPPDATCTRHSPINTAVTRTSLCTAQIFGGKRANYFKMRFPHCTRPSPTTEA